MDIFDEQPCDIELAPGAMILGGFARDEGERLLTEIAEIAMHSPFRRMVTPSGYAMSAAMTNCGNLGWVTDRSGYRYDPIDPETGMAWPTMPCLFSALASRAADSAGFPPFEPDACLINRYEPGARLSLHQDRNERAFDAPIVSISLGVPGTFLWGGVTRSERPRRLRLCHGDVVVWGGPARLTFHGIDVLCKAEHRATGDLRYNLTFRRAG